jgi:hypothetical protein
MPTYYDYGLGLDDPTIITESGDELASAANYIEPENVDFAHYTWENQPISERSVRLTRDADFPQLSSPLIYITIPSGSPHIIEYGTNTVLVSGIADENNDETYTLDYRLTGDTTGTGNITAETAWSFTTPILEVGDTTVTVNINSVKGPRTSDSTIITRSPDVVDDLYIVPNEKITPAGSWAGYKFGSCTDLDCFNNGIISGTPNDTTGFQVLDDLVRVGFEDPSFSGTSTQIKVRTRNRSDSSDGVQLTLYSDGTNSDGVDGWTPGGSWATQVSTFTVAKTAAQLTNIQVKFQSFSGAFDDQVSEMEIEIVK